MFFWYKKGGVSGKPVASRIVWHFIIGVIVLAVIGGAVFFFSGSKEIVSVGEMQSIAAEEGFAYTAGGDNEAIIEADGVTASVIECASSEEASELFEKYCAEYPADDADNTQNIELGDSYNKYSASRENGVIIAVRMDSRVAVVMTDDIANEDAAKEMFDQLVK